MKRIGGSEQWQTIWNWNVELPVRVEKGRKGRPHLRETLTMLEDHDGGFME